MNLNWHALAVVVLIGLPTLVRAQTISQSCSGTETVQIGSEAPKAVNYELTFSADLNHQIYCYGVCGKDQTYPIADIASVPLKLANVDGTSQSRHLEFDPRNATLIDHQVIRFGMLSVKRDASATCKPAAFHQPWLGAPSK